MIHKTLHRKREIEQYEPHYKPGLNLGEVPRKGKQFLYKKQNEDKTKQKTHNTENQKYQQHKPKISATQHKPNQNYEK